MRLNARLADTAHAFKSSTWPALAQGAFKWYGLHSVMEAFTQKMAA